MEKPMKFWVCTAGVMLVLAACELPESSIPEGPLSPANLRSQSGDFSFERVPDFSLIDLNESSPSFETQISALTFSGKITGWYFGSAL